MGHVSPVINQGAFRWRNDDGDETSGGATWLEAANVDTTLDFTSVFSTLTKRIRIETYEQAGADDSNFTATLQYRRNGGTWTNVGTSSADFVYMTGSGSGLTDGSSTTDHGITPTGTGAFTSSNAGQAETDGIAGGSNYDPAANSYAFMEYAVTFSKTSGLANGDTLDFRISEVDNVATADYPRATIAISTINVKQDDIAIRFDAGNESSAGAGFAVLPQRLDHGRDVAMRLRAAISEVGGTTPGAKQYIVQYRVNAGTWTSIVGKTTTDPAMPYASSGLSNGSATTNHGVTGTGSFSGVGEQCTDGLTGSITLPASSFMILEFGVRVNASQFNEGDYIEFRVAYSDGTALTSYDTTWGYTGDRKYWTAHKGTASDAGDSNGLVGFQTRYRADDGSEASGGATFLTAANEDFTADVSGGNATFRRRASIGIPVAGSTTNAIDKTYMVTSWGGELATGLWDCHGTATEITSSSSIFREAATSLSEGAHCTQHGVTATGCDTWVASNYGQTDINQAWWTGASGLSLSAENWLIEEYGLQVIAADVSDGEEYLLVGWRGAGPGSVTRVVISATASSNVNLSAVTATAAGVDPAITATSSADVALSAVVATSAGVDPAITATSSADVALSAVVATSAGVDPALAATGSAAVALSAVVATSSPQTLTVNTPQILALSAVTATVAGVDPAMAATGSAAVALSAVVATSSPQTLTTTATSSATVALSAVPGTLAGVDPAMAATGSAAVALSAVVATSSPQTLTVTSPQILNLSAVPGTLAGVDPAITATGSAAVALSAVTAALAIPGGTPWSPLDLADLFVWWNPDDAVLSGSAIDSIPDAGGSGIDLYAQGTSSLIGTINGVTAVDSQNSATNYLRADGDLSSVVEFYTLVENGAGDTAWIASQGGTTTRYFGVAQSGSTAATENLSGSPTYGVDATDLTAPDRGDLYTALVGTHVLEARNVDLSAWGSVFRPFYYGGGGGLQHAGAYGDIVLTSAALSTADRQKVQGYLAHKYGQQANLPAGHPYKTSPPGGGGPALDLAATGSAPLILSAVVATSAGVDPAITATSSAPLALSAVTATVAGVDPALAGAGAVALSLSAVVATSSPQTLTLSTAAILALSAVTATAAGVDPALAATGSAAVSLSAVVSALAGVDPAITATGSADVALSAVPSALAGVDPAITATSSATVALSAVPGTLAGVDPALAISGSAPLALSAVVALARGFDPFLANAEADTVNLTTVTATAHAVDPTLSGSGVVPVFLSKASGELAGVDPALVATGSAAVALSAVVATSAGVDPAITATGPVALALSAVVSALSGVDPTIAATSSAPLALSAVVATSSPVSPALSAGLVLSAVTAIAATVPFHIRAEIPRQTCPVPTGYVLPTIGPGLPGDSRQRGGVGVHSCPLPRGYPAPNRVYLETPLARLTTGALSVA